MTNDNKTHCGYVYVVKKVCIESLSLDIYHLIRAFIRIMIMITIDIIQNRIEMLRIQWDVTLNVGIR